MKKTYKADFYFDTYDNAKMWAVENFWPTDRIKCFGRGWAIQCCIAGPYAGTESYDRTSKKVPILKNPS